MVMEQALDSYACVFFSNIRVIRNNHTTYIQITHRASKPMPVSESLSELLGTQLTIVHHHGVRAPPSQVRTALDWCDGGGGRVPLFDVTHNSCRMPLTSLVRCVCVRVTRGESVASRTEIHAVHLSIVAASLAASVAVTQLDVEGAVRRFCYQVFLSLLALGVSSRSNSYRVRMRVSREGSITV